MSHVEIQTIDHQLVVTINRPEKRNAFNPEVIQALTKAFKEAESVPGVRSVLLKGAGKSFCAGADLDWMKSMAQYSEQENLQDALELYDLFKAVAECSLPVVAQVQGHVMGGANGLIAVCDIVAAEKDTQFAFSEVRLGLVPATISPFILKKMSPGFARKAMLTGDRFSADQALSSGLVQFVGSSDQVNAYMAELNVSFKSSGPEALRETKRLCGLPEIHQGDQLRAATARSIARARVGAEAQAGLNAFFNKSRPEWKVDQ